MTADRPAVLPPVLFVCTMNAVRSPMAAALMRHHIVSWKPLFSAALGGPLPG